MPWWADKGVQNQKQLNVLHELCRLILASPVQDSEDVEMGISDIISGEITGFSQIGVACGTHLERQGQTRHVKICHVPGVSKCILGANHRRHVCENCCWLKLGLNLGTATAKVFLVIPWFCFVRAILVGTIQKLNGLKLCQVPIVRFSSEFEPFQATFRHEKTTWHLSISWHSFWPIPPVG